MKTVAQSLLLVLVSSFACVVGLELTARLLLPPHPIYLDPQPKHDVDPVLGWVLRPSQQAYTQQVPVAINDAGLRDDEPLAAEKPAGEARILVLGDSVTFGNGVATPETYCEVLEARLKAQGLAVRVLNAGVQGYSIHQEADYLRERGLATSPDAIVIGLYENDVTIRKAQASDASELLARAEAGKFDMLPRPVVQAVRRLRSVVFLDASLREARWRWLPPEADYHIRDFFRGEASPESERAWRDVRQSLVQIRSDASASGIEALLAVFPHPTQLVPGILERSYQARALALAEEIELPALDLLPAFRAAAQLGESPFIPFDGHPSASGHRAAGGALAGPVAQMLSRAGSSAAPATAGEPGLR